MTFPGRGDLSLPGRRSRQQFFGQVRAAGLDESWWKIDPIPNKPVIAGKNNVFQYLLALGYSSNTLPLAAPT